MAQQDYKKQTPGKNNPNNLPGTDEDPKKRPRFNVYWIYGLIFAAIVGYNLFRGVNSTGVETDQIKFYEMVQQGDIDQIKTVGNKKIVRVSINKDSLLKKSDYYRSKFKDYDLVAKSPQPQMYFKIIKDETFASEKSEFYKLHPEVKQVPDVPDDEGELFGQII